MWVLGGPKKKKKKEMSPSSNGRRRSSGSGGGGGGEGVNYSYKYIEHQVSKFDTLAGVAIKYGVEVFLFLSKTRISTSFSFLCFYVKLSQIH